MDVQHILTILGNLLNEMSPYILLGFLFAGILHAFVRADVMSHHFAGNGFRQSLKAALLGVPLPLCSCGVLPTAISLRRSGASNAATTSFLIATPQTGIDSIAATYSLLGPAFAIVRPVAAFVTAVLGGTIMGKVAKEDATVDDECKLAACDARLTFGGKVKEMLRYGFVDMPGSVGKWLVVGLVVAALITALIPDDFFVGFARYPFLAMVAVVVIAIPMYVCATGSIPIALSLMLKGLTPGVAFVFLMAGPAANFASYTLLSHAMGRRNTLIYIGIIAVSAICIGMIIDTLLPASWFAPRMAGCEACCVGGHGAVWFNTLCSALLVMMLIYALVIKRFKKNKVEKIMTKEYRINGMMCVHCKARVEKGLASVAGVTAVSVDLGRKVAVVEGEHSEKDIEECVNALGYEYVGLNNE
jgi:hypothetical protein